MQTYRRLDDRVRLYGLTISGMFGVAAAIALVYVAIRISPFALKPTVTISALLAGVVGAVFVSLHGQAMNPGQYMVAIIRWRLGARFYGVTERAPAGGVLVDAVPAVLAVGPLVDEPPEWDDALDDLASVGASS